jgi:lipopolysaccharide/colanic/teichoic acid biosynthesis glycosyltransferase
MNQQTFVPYPLFKRLTDKLVALALILLLSPLYLIALLAMGADMLLRPADRGPWLYRERRISRGQEFDILKFRVLRADALGRMAQEAQFARLYEREPANLTWAGRRVLKPWYLDELPQLFNILNGDMSLVGPRPWPLAKYQDQLASGIDYRKYVRAGWTGPAQLLKGRAGSQAQTEQDIQYVERCRTWSGWRLWRYDLAVLYKTIRIMLEGKGLKY